ARLVGGSAWAAAGSVWGRTAGFRSHLLRSIRHSSWTALVSQAMGNWRAALIAHLPQLQLQPRPWQAAYRPDGRAACGSPGLETSLTLTDTLCNTQSQVSGHDTKGNRTLRKLSTERALP